MTASSLRIIRDEHTAVAAVLRSLEMLVDRGPGERPDRFFDTVRSMLFYIDEFPERRHHPNESNLLFPLLVRSAPELAPVIDRLEVDHEAGESRVRELQHLLLGWEILGETRREAFTTALREYVRFYLQHMRTEETQLLPVAQQRFSTADWVQLDAAFENARDPLAGGQREAIYEALFTRIVMKAPAPIGVGDE